MALSSRGFLFILVSLEFIFGLIAGQSCPPHPVPATGFSSCSAGRKHKSLCETKCNKGFRLKGPSRMMCWCKAGKCSWRGVKASCERMKCDLPDLEDGSFRLIDVWERGFAGIVEMDNVVAPRESEFGWSTVIIFDRPLGKKVSLLSWNLEPTATSYDGQTFTLVNSKNRVKLSQMLDDKGRLSVLLVADNIDGEKPKSAFVGLYYKRVRDATCLVAPKMPAVRSLYSDRDLPAIETTAVPKTTTPGVTQTLTTVSEAATKPPRKTKPSTTKTAKSAITSTTVASTTQSTPATTVASTSQSTESQTTLAIDGSYCVIQKHDEYMVVEESWEDRGQHYFGGNFGIKYPKQLPDWRMVVIFEDEIEAIETWAINVLHSSDDGLIWTFGPHPWKTQLNAGGTDIRFIATQAYATVRPPKAQIFLCSETFTEGDAVIGGTGLGLGLSTDDSDETEAGKMTTTGLTTTPTASSFQCSASAPSGRPVVRAGQTMPNFKANNDGTKYNYNEILHKSLLFYEAQRSGPLPQNNRIPWRADSGLKDGCDIGVDVTGGWYDAGDNVKFNFPMAYSLTTLAWGGILFRDAYDDAGELAHMIDAIKWATKYFIKTHISKYELVVQVGHGETDHNYWGRPEEMTMNRPAYKITTKKPGTEVAAETSAALAASSIFLRSSDPELADEALAHSKQLFEFADKYRASYHVSVPDAALYYKSYSGYQDELVWAATWLYKATNESVHLSAAEKAYKRMRGKYRVAHEFSWDFKLAGAQALLAEMTGSEDYRRPFLQYLNDLPKKKTTPQGLYYIGDWGSNRYAANAAFMLIVGSKITSDAAKKKQYLNWAEKQIGILLGDTGRSYVVGFGVNPPKQPHHTSSSCPPYPERCDWTVYHSPKPNHYILYGALVGGPNIKGVFVDNRTLYQETEVACDYNAGFQSAVAGLKYQAMKKRNLTTTKITTTTTAKTTTPEVTTTATESTTATTKNVKAASANKTKSTKKIPCRPWRSRKCAKARAAKKNKTAKQA